MTTQSLIEALLFSRSEPWTPGDLAKALGKELPEIQESITALEESLSGRGLCLVRTEGQVTLGTHPDAHAVLQQLYKDELGKGLSKASVETLSIVMYGTEVTRGKIDFIRGVNSGFILRSLLVRGLIERKPYPRDRKSFMYVPTIDLLAQFGVQNVESLPDYAKIHAELDTAAIGAEPVDDTPNAEIQTTTEA